MHGAETVGLLCIGDYRMRPRLEITQEITHNFLKVKKVPQSKFWCPSCAPAVEQFWRAPLHWNCDDAMFAFNTVGPFWQ